eukprot:4181529-Pyramimonas_sp.AAC.1
MAVAMRPDWQASLNQRSPTSSLTRILCSSLLTRACNARSLSSMNDRNQARLQSAVIALSTSRPA